MAQQVTQFGQAADAYGAFRPGYPRALFDAILQVVPPNKTRALDLGAGTGLSTQRLAAVFGQVVAAEPDAAMTEKIEFPANVTVVNDCAENLTFLPGSFALVTSGNAFYWMDGPAITALACRWLQPGGILAAYRYDEPTTDNDTVNAVLQREDTLHWDAFRHQRLRDTGYTQRTIEDSGLFSAVTVQHIENTHPLNAAELVGFFASTSYVNGYLQSHNNRDAYLASLQNEIEAIVDGGPLAVDFALELVLAKKE